MGGEVDNLNRLATLYLLLTTPTGPKKKTRRGRRGERTKKDWLGLVIVLGSVLSGRWW